MKTEPKQGLPFSEALIERWFYAAETGDVSTLRKLVAKGFPVNLAERSTGQTALGVSIMTQQLECFNFLLPLSDIDAPQDPLKNSNALMLALRIKTCPLSCITSLITPASCALYKDHLTALLIACYYHRYDALPFLLPLSPIHATTRHGENALWCLVFNHDKAPIDLLLPFLERRDFEQKSNEGLDAIALAFELNEPHLAHLLKSLYTSLCEKTVLSDSLLSTPSLPSPSPKPHPRSL